MVNNLGDGTGRERALLVNRTFTVLFFRYNPAACSGQPMPAIIQQPSQEP